MSDPRDRVRAHVAATFPARINAPAGGLPHPFIDPGAGYEGILWDWDACFCLRGLAPWADAVAPAALGCVRNLLHHQRSDGSVPYSLMVTSTPEPGGVRPADGPANSCKPLLAQFALMAADYAGDDAVLDEVWPGLVRHYEHWRATQLAACGLTTFRSHRGSGSDDHPAVYCRPFDSTASVFLNGLMHAELTAMATIAGRRGRPDEADVWRCRADELAAVIRTLMWDPIDGCFHDLDVGRGDPGRVNQPVTWPVPLKFRHWSMVLPLWAGVATTAQAERLLTTYVLAPDELRCPHGLRSLSPKEPAYEIAVGSNPSCWRGPVWVISTWFAWEALRRYGFAVEAATLADDLLALLARDLETTGVLHEYYHPDTGAGLTHPGFLNWNTLAALM